MKSFIGLATTNCPTFGWTDGPDEAPGSRIFWLSYIGLIIEGDWPEIVTPEEYEWQQMPTCPDDELVLFWGDWMVTPMVGFGHRDSGYRVFTATGTKTCVPMGWAPIPRPPNARFRP
jgi:hypothetical protein